MKYSVGYGLCKEDFTIDQVELASFINENDAYQFIRMKFDNDLSNFFDIFSNCLNKSVSCPWLI